MKFRVFKSKTNHLVVVDEKGNVYDEMISPHKMTQVTEFEADGQSDFNCGMIRSLLEYGQNSLEKNEAKKIDVEGL